MTKKEEMYKSINTHGERLINIFNLPPDTDTIKLSKNLFSLENIGNRLAVRYCNGDIEMEQFIDASNKILEKVDKILGYKKKGIPVFFNSDARGYALKIKETWIEKNGIDMYKDWGGYGIIAPNFNP